MKFLEIMCMIVIKKQISTMVYWFFHKKTGSGIIVNEHLAEELQKSANKKFKRRNNWVADLTEMEILSSKNKNAKYLCITDAFTKYAWVKP